MAANPQARGGFATQGAVVAAQNPTDVTHSMSPREKAAIIVRILLSEGASLNLASLPEDLQTALAQQMGKMRRVSRATMNTVVREFLVELEGLGLAFPSGLTSTLSLMEGYLSDGATGRLRRLSADNIAGDPWQRIVSVPTEFLLPVLLDEGVEVCAVILSKLPAALAAELLSKVPGDRARQLAYAVSLTGDIAPEAVRRIGLSVAEQLDNRPIKAFKAKPGERVGAILTSAPAALRDNLMKGLHEADAQFAETVEKSILPFEDIKTKLGPRDVPAVVRLVDAAALATALAFARTQPKLDSTAEFILANLPQRMAQSLREEAASRGKVKTKDGEEALGKIVAVIRQLETSGEITLEQADD